MKRIALSCFGAALAATLAHAGPADDVKAAATALLAQPSYSWTTTVELPNSNFTPGPADGQTEKGGYTVITHHFNDRAFSTVLKDDRRVFETPDGWMTPAELEEQGGRGATMARAKITLPAEDVAELAKQAQSLALADGVISGELTTADAADHLMFGRRGPGITPPKNARGSVKFWLQDGRLMKYQLHLQGTVTFGPDGEERDIEIISTTVFKNVGNTKVDVPAEARAKLGA